MSTVNPKVPYHSQRGIPCQSLLVSYPMLRVHHVRRCPAPGDGAELVSPSASALPLPCRRRNQAWKRPPCHDDPHIMGILRLYWRIMKARMVSCCKSMYNVLDFFWWCTWKISKYVEVKTPNSSKHYLDNFWALDSSTFPSTIKYLVVNLSRVSKLKIQALKFHTLGSIKMIHAPFLMVFHSEHVHQPTVNCWLLVGCILVSPHKNQPKGSNPTTDLISEKWYPYSW